ncbi:hypothetical protein THAOC_24976, partial [Thalassiosira oceanica]
NTYLILFYLFLYDIMELVKKWVGARVVKGGGL